MSYHILLYDTGDIRYELNEPLGIEVIASNLEAKTNRQCVVDIKWYNQDQLHFHLDPYHVVGVSLTIGSLDIFDHIYIKCSTLPVKPFIIVGNVWGTYGYEYLLHKYPDIICVIGEGEMAFSDLVNAFKQYGNGFIQVLSQIPNIAYKQNGKTILTKRVIMDLNDYILPKRAFTDFLKNKKGIARLEASRGCAWNKCTFCSTSHKYSNHTWRPIKIEKVLTQIVELHNNGFRFLYFTDEDFIGDQPNRFSSLVDEIHKLHETTLNGSSIHYFISIKPNDVLDAHILNILNRFTLCGLQEIFIGIESGSNSQLKRYGKNSSATKNIEVLNRLKSLDADVDIGFIFFDIDMTMDELYENIEFIEKTQLYLYNANIIKKMRIHPYSSTYYSHIKHQSLILNPKTLSFDYSFKDETIGKIYNDYIQLNLESHANKLQSLTRGEFHSEHKRKQIIEKTKEIRALQFQALKTIVSYYDRQLYDKDSYKSELEAFETHCSVIINEAMKIESK